MDEPHYNLYILEYSLDLAPPSYEWPVGLVHVYSAKLSAQLWLKSASQVNWPRTQCQF